jgi:hypothetical protein
MGHTHVIPHDPHGGFEHLVQQLNSIKTIPTLAGLNSYNDLHNSQRICLKTGPTQIAILLLKNDYFFDYNTPS